MHPLSCRRGLRSPPVHQDLHVSAERRVVWPQAGMSPPALSEAPDGGPACILCPAVPRTGGCASPALAVLLSCLGTGGASASTSLPGVTVLIPGVTVLVPGVTVLVPGVTVLVPGLHSGDLTCPQGSRCPQHLLSRGPSPSDSWEAVIPWAVPPGLCPAAPLQREGSCHLLSQHWDTGHGGQTPPTPHPTCRMAKGSIFLRPPQTEGGC